MIGVQGDDVQTVQLDIMKNQLESLASRKSQFIWLNNISDLIGTFSSIAINLTDQWKNLSCTSALNHNGLVCWTLGEKPRVKKHMLLGINMGLGFGIRYGSSFKLDFGIDCSYPITPKFGMGGYFSAGADLSSAPCISIGLLTTIGNYHEKAAFIGGLGCNVDLGYGPNADIRLGVLFRKGVYVMTTMSMGSVPYAMTFNIGYNFGALFEVK